MRVFVRLIVYAHFCVILLSSEFLGLDGLGFVLSSSASPWPCACSPWGSSSNSLGLSLVPLAVWVSYELKSPSHFPAFDLWFNDVGLIIRRVTLFGQTCPARPFSPGRASYPRELEVPGEC